MLIVCLFLMGNTKGRENLPPLSLSEATRRCPLPVDPRRAGRDDPWQTPTSNGRPGGSEQQEAGWWRHRLALTATGGSVALVRPHLERVGEMRKERGELDMKSEIYLVCWREVQYKDEILAKWLAKIEFG